MKTRKGMFNYPRANKTGWTRWLPSLRLVSWSALGVVVLAVAGFCLGYALTDIPKPNQAAAAQTSIVYYDDAKTQIGTFSVQNRQSVGIDKISKPMQQAAVAAEDRTFYENRGVSVTGLGRAVVGVVTGNYAGGGSTITQQYVKNFYLTDQHSYVRKVKEMFISLKLDQQTSKDDLLASYLNTIYLGRQNYGIQTAAQDYFGKPASELDLAQSAMLAAMIQSPGKADAAEDPGAYQDRFNYVLDGMVSEGFISAADREGVQLPKVNKQKATSNALAGDKGYMMQLVRKELTAKAGLSDAQIDGGGYRIVTTFDKKKMADARAAVESLPKKQPKGTHTALASIDPKDGALVAFYGGDDYLKRQQNAATQDSAQAGSTFKAFTLVAALEKGIRLNDTYSGANNMEIPGTDYANKPLRNFGGESFGRISLLTATENSVNTVFGQLNKQVTPSMTRETAIKAGVPEVSDPGSAGYIDTNIGNVLGDASPHPVDMASAYSTFAAQGMRHDWFTVRSVKTAAGKETYKPDTKGTRAFDKAVMAETSYALSHVVTSGSGGYAANLGRPAAGKTGTTNNNLSAWFDGYTPQLATAVSMYRMGGKDGNTAVPLEGFDGVGEITGGTLPTQVWERYMSKALAGEPVKQFPARGELPPRDPGLPAPVRPKPTPHTPTPTERPTHQPTVAPTEEPTQQPTQEPTQQPTQQPSVPPKEPDPEPTGGHTVQPDRPPATDPAGEGGKPSPHLPIHLPGRENGSTGNDG